MSRLLSRPTAHHWGAGIATVDDGILKRVDPHPDDPDPSAIHDNIVEGIYGKSRIRRPSVRKSYLEAGPMKASRNRGRDAYVEVDWDTALDLITGELTRVRKDYGNRAIYGGSYGWASAGRFHHAQSQLKRFLNAAGGYVSSEGNYSYNAALMLMPHIIGNFRNHVRDATRWKTVAEEGQLVVMFGGIPLRNTQVSGGGVVCHRTQQDLLDCSDRGVRFVNLSPLESDAIKTLKAEWLPPRPGTDTAVMMGLAYTLLSEGLHDLDFINRYTVGFDRVSAYLLGEVDGVVKDTEWAEQMSGIPGEKIKCLAREMASSRTLISTAVSLQRARFGEQPLWMTITLASMLGQIGLPGGGYGIGYGADSSIGTVNRPFRWPSFPQGTNPVEDFIPVACVADMLLNPGTSYPYNGNTRSYPDIRLVWWAGGNPFHHHQDLNKLHRAFQMPETIIVNEINWTATARHADIVLPVVSSMEREDFGAGTQDNAVIPMPKLIDPVGDAREEYEIYRDLEKRLGLGTDFSDGLNAREWLERLWDEMKLNGEKHHDAIPGFEAFMSGNVIHFDDPSPEAIYLENFRRAPDQSPLATPSGKIELWSKTIDSFEYADCPGQAVWLEPEEWQSGSRYPLDMISGQPATRLHSQFDAGALSVAKKVQGREPVLIHPEDAAARSISEGDIVRLFNDRGSCLAGASITNKILRGVVFLWTGAWFDPDFSSSDHRDNHGNPNVLTHDLRTSSLSQGPTAQARIDIEKYEGDLPPVKAFDPPISE
ncbi:MAG: molybdopterin-dependent oxidoreductase [Pseudomonadota bacterium]